MNLAPVITQLRQHAPIFSGRVAGAAQFSNIDAITNMTVPAAVVIPLDDSPGECIFLNDVNQPLMDAFAVVVAVDNTSDEKGQAAVESAHDIIRAQLWAALLGWQPDGLAANSRYRGIEYQGGNLLKLDRSRLWYQFDFAAKMCIRPSDGWQQTELNNDPPFDGMNITIDQNAIDLSITVPPSVTLP